MKNMNIKKSPCFYFVQNDQGWFQEKNPLIPPLCRQRGLNLYDVLIVDCVWQPLIGSKIYDVNPWVYVFQHVFHLCHNFSTFFCFWCAVIEIWNEISNMDGEMGGTKPACRLVSFPVTVSKKLLSSFFFAWYHFLFDRGLTPWWPVSERHLLSKSFRGINLGDDEKVVTFLPVI